jgi:sec-independent protein translocase protein TatB
MLGLGWSEMLVIGVVILIVVGPKDLPVMMRNIGRMMGTVRRMSNEFRREIDKAIAADEIREAKKAISDPLKQTSQDISREFNALRNGKVEPSGKLAPVEPGKESVVDEIREKAGMSPAALALRSKVSETVAKPANAVTTTAGADESAPIKAKAAPKNARTSTAGSKAAKPAAKATRARTTKKASPETGSEPAPASVEAKTAPKRATKKTPAKKTPAKKATASRAKSTKSAADVGGED